MLALPTLSGKTLLARSLTRSCVRFRAQTGRPRHETGAGASDLPRQVVVERAFTEQAFDHPDRKLRNDAIGGNHLFPLIVRQEHPASVAFQGHETSAFPTLPPCDARQARQIGGVSELVQRGGSENASYRYGRVHEQIPETEVFAELENDRRVDPDDLGDRFRSRMGDSPAVRDDRAVTEPVDEPAVGVEAFLQRREEIESAGGAVPVDGAEAGERIQVRELPRFRLDGSLCLGLAARCVASKDDDGVCSRDVVLGGAKSELSHLVAHPARTFLKRQDKRIAMRVRQTPQPLHQRRVSSSVFKPRLVERKMSRHPSFLQERAGTPDDQAVGILFAPDGIADCVVAMRCRVHDCLVNRNGRKLRQLLEPALGPSFQIGLEESGLLQKGTKIPYLLGDRSIEGSIEAGRRPVLLAVKRNIEAKNPDMCLRQLALGVRPEEQDPGIREPPVAGHRADLAEQVMIRPFVGCRIEIHLPEFLHDTAVQVVFVIFRARRPFEVHDALVALELLPLLAGQRKILRSAPEPSAWARPHGLAYRAFRIGYEKEGDLVRRAVLRDNLVQLGLTIMGDENVVQLQEPVDLSLVQMLQPSGRSVGCDADDE